MKIKAAILIGVSFTVILIIVFIYLNFSGQNKFYSPLGSGKILDEKKLTQYSYPALQKTVFTGSQFTIDKILKDEEEFTSHLFYFTVRGKKVSGLLNLPKKPGNYPVIIMLRGYVDREIYQTGVGTSHGGEVLTQNGFITLAPDFLDYGSSDKTKLDSLESRFMTYVTVLELIASTKNLNSSLEDSGLSPSFDGEHLGLWGHSNGGQIALSILEITGKEYPTVLWAPVSKPFPYSILFYTDDIPDHGKALRKVVADFEKDYDSEKYSLINYFDWIQAPLEIHQGGDDESVPLTWSENLVDTLKNKEKEVEYYAYPGENHNFNHGSWNLIMQRTIAFYKNQFDL